MVDFRKWLFALAAVGLLLGIGSSAANAQGTSFSCTTAASVNNIVRAEGIAELVGDLVLNCSGGTATAAATPIPLSNIQITLNTAVTSRLVNAFTSVSEALLLIDDPYPSAGVPPDSPPGTLASNANPNLPHATVQLACIADNNTNCAINGTGGGFGANGPYSGAAGHYNIFQGSQTATNAITWTGVPVDAPGSTGFTRIIRITNIRADANQLGVVSSLIPTNVLMYIAVNGNANLSINQPPSGNVVAQVQPGIGTLPGPYVAVNDAFPPASGQYQQCNAVNTYLTSPPGTVFTDYGLYVNATEGFAYSWKPQNWLQIYAVRYGGSPVYYPSSIITDDWLNQDVPGVSYGTESGFMPNTAVAQPTAAGANELVGLADRGTQIQFTVSGIGANVNLYAPSFVYLSGAYGATTPVGVAVLTTTPTASGAFSFTDLPVGYSNGAFGIVTTPGGTTSATVPATGLPTTATQVAITPTGTTATLTYEIYYADPNVQESIAVPLSVEYAAGAPSATTAPATVTVSFSPQNTASFPSVTNPIPRFAPSGSPLTLFSISSCTCDLLFPFVSSANGFDTGIAIANTSDDPFGTPHQSGTVTLNYYAAGGGAPPPAATSGVIPGGQELVFDMYSGGSGIAATPGFTGYIIAQANFEFCHGYAFISNLGLSEPGLFTQGYLAIVLNPYGLVRGVPAIGPGELRGN